jgi:hypothetical protein
MFASLSISLLVAMGILAHSVAAAPESYQGNTTSSTIEWTDCSPDPSIELKCANISVPLD